VNFPTTAVNLTYDPDQLAWSTQGQGELSCQISTNSTAGVKMIPLPKNNSQGQRRGEPSLGLSYVFIGSCVLGAVFALNRTAAVEWNDVFTANRTRSAGLRVSYLNRADCAVKLLTDGAVADDAVPMVIDARQSPFLLRQPTRQLGVSVSEPTESHLVGRCQLRTPDHCRPYTHKTYVQCNISPDLGWQAELTFIRNCWYQQIELLISTIRIVMLISTTANKC